MSVYDDNEGYDDYLDDDPGPSRRVSSLERSESVDEDAESAVKKRKVSRACDVCRRRKVRCDFVELPSGNLQKCLNCFSSKIECTFTEDSKPRRTSKNYVQSLEKKVERNEKLLQLLCPDPSTRQGLLEGDLDAISTGLRTPNAASSTDSSYFIVENLTKAIGSNPVELAVMAARSQMYRRYPAEHTQYHGDDQHEDEDDIADADHLSRITHAQMKIKQEETEDKLPAVNPFYLGKSSARALLTQVVKIKNQSRSGLSPMASTPRDEETDTDRSALRRPGPYPERAVDYPSPNSDADMSEDATSTGEHDVIRSEHEFLGRLRPQYWQILPWERSAFRTQSTRRDLFTQFDFPEPSLFKALVDNYFKYTNIELPLLHRPTFEKEVAEGLHLRDITFGATVLLVCSIGARYSDDPQVRLSEEDARKAAEDEQAGSPSDGLSSTPGAGKEPSSRELGRLYHSRGWEYFERAWNAVDNHVFFRPPTLYDLQFYCLATEYLRGTSVPQGSWLTIGIGLRLGQEIGAHRRLKKDVNVLDPELVRQEELRKRAFWVLVTLDRFLSCATGRPGAISDEGMDLDLPVECDDEYWSTPDPSILFKQPEGKPSKMTAFILAIRLNQILTTCLKTIYSINKAKTLGGLLRGQWESKVVSEIDSAMNKWLDIVPPHLRWNPQQPNDTFFMQSAALHASYHHLQILVHRPFIPSPNRPTPEVDFPSLTICTSAARSLIHVGLAQLERLGEVSDNMPLQILSASVVLLLRFWEDRRTGKLTEQMFKAGRDDLNSCLRILEVAEKRWYSAGKLRDLLQSLIPEKGMLGVCTSTCTKDGKPQPERQTKETSAQSPFSVQSPFAKPGGMSLSPPTAQAPPSQPSTSRPTLSAMTSPLTLNTFPSTPSMRNSISTGDDYRTSPLRTLNSSSVTAQAPNPDAQWSAFASGPLGLETPQQYMFTSDPTRQQQSGGMWSEPSDMYRPQCESGQEGHRRQDSFGMEYGLGQALSSPFSLDLFSSGGMQDMGNDQFMTGGPFVPPPSSLWSDPMGQEPGSTGGGPSGSANMPSSQFDTWQYLNDLVDLTSRNDLVSQLFPSPPTAGYGAGL